MNPISKRFFVGWIVAMVFCLTVGASLVQAEAKININSAPTEMLQTLPGVGPALAERIISYRSETPFETIEDIKKVKGIGDATFEKIKGLLTVE